MFYSSGRLFWCVSCAVRFLSVRLSTRSGSVSPGRRLHFGAFDDWSVSWVVKAHASFRRRVCGSTTGKFRAASVGALGVFFVEIARRCRYLVSVVCRGSCVRFLRVRVVLGYLVDPASSHMLVSKIKPCMSKYKRLYCETANGSLNQLWFI